MASAEQYMSSAGAPTNWLNYNPPPQVVSGMHVDQVSNRVGASPMMPGGPQYPGFLKITQPNGMLPTHLQLRPDTRALEAMRGQATRTDLSPWSQMQLQTLQQQQMREGDLATMQRQGELGNIWQQLGGYNPEMAARLGLQRTMGEIGLGSQPEMQLRMEDRMQQMNTLRQQPLLEIQGLAPQQFNIQAALQEKAAMEQAKLQSYEEQYKALAGAQTAAAMMMPQRKFLGLI